MKTPFLTLVTLIAFCSISEKNLAQEWVPLGDGVDHLIRDFYPDEEAGLLYAVGSFRYAGEDTVGCIATWNGEEWQNVGYGSLRNCYSCSCDPILTIEKFQGDIYTAGNFIESVYPEYGGVVRWNGTSWDSIGVSSSKIFRLYAHGDSLYAIGADTVGGVYTPNVAIWDGSVWSAVDETSFDGLGLDVIVYKNQIYLGGNFYNDSLNYEYHLVRWNGTYWEQVGSDIIGPGYVSEFAIFQDELYVAGVFFKDIAQNPGNHIAKWDGEEWSDVGGGVKWDGEFQGAGIHSMYADEDYLYVLGFFHEVGDLDAYYIAAWDGENWCSFGTDFIREMSRVTVFQDTLHLGLVTDFLPDQEHNWVAKWTGSEFEDCSSPVSTIDLNTDQEERLKLYPNPTDGVFYLEFPDETQSSIKLEIFTVQGSLVFSSNFASGNNLYPVSRNLENGLYL